MLDSLFNCSSASAFDLLSLFRASPEINLSVPNSYQSLHTTLFHVPTKLLAILELDSAIILVILTFA
jgi:hypothetical protein